MMILKVCETPLLTHAKTITHKRRRDLDIDKILSELKNERDRIGRAISALLDGASSALSTGESPRRERPRGRGKGITAAGRKRLSEATKARWAARKPKSSSTASATTSSRQKRRAGMSAAGRRRIAEAMRKRWAEKRRAASQGRAERKAQA